MPQKDFQFLLACPICQSEQELLIPATADESFWRCTVCQLVFQRKLPNDVVSIYRRGIYDNRREAYDGMTAWNRFRHDYAVALKRLEQLSKCWPADKPPSVGMTWLDFGCNNGGFMAAAADIGYTCYGVESDPDFCREISSMLGFHVFETRAYLKCPISADVVSFFDVLEHLVWPVGILRRVTANSTIGDRIVIEVPDVGQYDGESLELFLHHKPDEHLLHFSLASLEAMREKHFPRFDLTHKAIPLKYKLQIVWECKR